MCRKYVQNNTLSCNEVLHVALGDIVTKKSHTSNSLARAFVKAIYEPRHISRNNPVHSVIL